MTADPRVISFLSRLQGIPSSALVRPNHHGRHIVPAHCTVPRVAFPVVLVRRFSAADGIANHRVRRLVHGCNVGAGPMGQVLLVFSDGGPPRRRQSTKINFDVGLQFPASGLAYGSFDLVRSTSAAASSPSRHAAAALQRLRPRSPQCAVKHDLVYPSCSCWVCLVAGSRRKRTRCMGRYRSEGGSLVMLFPPHHCRHVGRGDFLAPPRAVSTSNSASSEPSVLHRWRGRFITCVACARRHHRNAVQLWSYPGGWLHCTLRMPFYPRSLSRRRDLSKSRVWAS
ncbi:hypothetical protein C8Q79DRAFT_43956 [Trametes meyenii]|nr:hypothetical protein C8Q79DRAFT_43956 [Trametes meyenii]